MIYPKVLIIGQFFNEKSGGGITLSNLFRNWPKNALAVASNSNLQSGIDTTICDNYYQLCYGTKLHPFPLNLVLPSIPCGRVVFKKQYSGEGTLHKDRIQKKRNRIFEISTLVIKQLGMYEKLYYLRITEDFIGWVNNFDPDVIYTQLASVEQIRFITNLEIKTKKRIAIHIMDDWPRKFGSTGILNIKNQKLFQNEFHNLLNRASILMSISQAMSEEYKTRYNKSFIPFHNPIEIDKWLPYSRSDWNISKEFVILYAGRIGLGAFSSIIDIATAVISLHQEGYKIKFEIQSPDINLINRYIPKSDSIIFSRMIEYKELPKKLSNSDLLVIPVDFDKKSIEFLKYSIQTKVSEYMISGTPIIVYANLETAVAKYAKKSGWAYLITEKSMSKLKEGLIELYSNIELRQRLGEQAIDLAVKTEDSIKVRQNFASVLNGLPLSINSEVQP